MLVLAFVNIGCTTHRVAEGYRVMGFDSTSGKWIILRNGTFDGKYITKRLTVRCEFYKWGNREAVSGPNACDLTVGRLMVPRYPHDKNDYKTAMYIFEDANNLSIVEGDGDDRVMQQFFILKNEVVPE